MRSLRGKCSGFCSVLLIVSLAISCCAALADEPSGASSEPQLDFGLQLGDPSGPALSPKPRADREPRTARLDKKRVATEGRVPLPAAVQKNLSSPAQQSTAPKTVFTQRDGSLPQPLPADVPSSPHANQPVDRSQHNGRVPSGSQLQTRLGVKFGQRNSYVVVEELVTPGILQKAGVTVGDVVVSGNGRAIKNADQFNQLVSGVAPNATVEINVQRNGSDLVVQVRAADFLTVNPTSNRATLGVNLDSRYPDRVVLSNVTPGGPADQIGLQVGDVIVRVGDKKVRSTKELIQAIGQYAPGDKVEIEVSRGGKADSAVAELSAATRSPASAMNLAEPPSGILESAGDRDLEPAPNPFGADRVGRRDGERNPAAPHK